MRAIVVAAQRVVPACEISGERPQRRPSWEAFHEAAEAVAALVEAGGAHQLLHAAVVLDLAILERRRLERGHRPPAASMRRVAAPGRS